MRSWLHNSRFNWFYKLVNNLNFKDGVKAIELGCFDGRLLDYFPEPPVRYEGFDANWEGGLTNAQEKYAGSLTLFFHESQDPSDLSVFEKDVFNIGVALETIEHIPPYLVDNYLSQMARVIDGYLVVSVPNEKGIICLGKWLIKKAFLSGTMEKYKFSELIAATLGRMDKVERNEHKGFDYDVLIRQIARYFDIVQLEGIPVSWLPVSTDFTVCILAKSKECKI